MEKHKVIKGTFHSDAGHGWLAVKIKHLIELGLQDNITMYSYTKGCTVYLEEDYDMMQFCQAAKQQGIEIKIKDSRAKRVYSQIRRYNTYNASKINLIK
jgi:hypothetical protein